MKAKNLYLVSDLLLTAAGVSTIYAIYTRTLEKTPAVLGTASLLLFLYQALKGKSKVTNKSKSNVFCKDENSKAVYSIAPGESAEDIDGFKISGFNDGKIFKVCDGVHVTINEDCSVTVKSFIFSPYIQRTKKGGWRTYNSLPDDWDNLINA